MVIDPSFCANVKFLGEWAGEKTFFFFFLIGHFINLLHKVKNISFGDSEDLEGCSMKLNSEDICCYSGLCEKIC